MAQRRLGEPGIQQGLPPLSYGSRHGGPALFALSHLYNFCFPQPSSILAGQDVCPSPAVQAQTFCVLPSQSHPRCPVALSADWNSAKDGIVVSDWQGPQSFSSPHVCTSRAVGLHLRSWSILRVTREKDTFIPISQMRN